MSEGYTQRVLGGPTQCPKCYQVYPMGGQHTCPTPTTSKEGHDMTTGHLLNYHNVCPKCGATLHANTTVHRCEPSTSPPPEYDALKAENERLKQEIAKLRENSHPKVGECIELISDYTPLDDPNKLKFYLCENGDVNIAFERYDEDETGIRVVADGTRYPSEVRQALCHLMSVIQAAGKLEE